MRGQARLAGNGPLDGRVRRRIRSVPGSYKVTAKHDVAGGVGVLRSSVQSLPQA